MGTSETNIELYDLEQDPDEYSNLADRATGRAQRAELLAALQQWRVQTGDPLLDAGTVSRLEKIRMAAEKPVAPWYNPSGQ